MIVNIKEINGRKKSNILFSVILIVVVVLLIIIRVFLIDWINVSGESMLPTLQEGEVILVDKTKRVCDDLQYGDIVIIKKPNSDTQLVKRVVGKGGDIVEICDSTLYINGEAQQESYIYLEEFVDMNPVLVKESSIFVIGDNRNYSSDSRQIGSISGKNIVGKAICVIFPFDQIKLF